MLREALAMRRRLYPDGHAEVAASLGCSPRRWSISAASTRPWRGCARRTRCCAALYGDDHPYTSGSLAGYAEIVAASGDRAKAIGLYREALALARRNHPPGDFQLAGPTFGLGETLCAGGGRDDRADRHEGRGLLEQAAAIYATKLPADHPSRRAVAAKLATCAP